MVGTSDHQQSSGKPRVRSNAELMRLLGLRGGSAVRSVLELQRSAGNSAASGLVRLVLAGNGPAAMSEVEGGLALHGRTTARYNGGRWRIARERATSVEGCDCPPRSRCLHLTGDLVSAYAVTVRISMPGVPAGLTPCQRRRVRDFLREVLRPHENDHARRFRTYNGRTVISLDLTGCGRADLSAQVTAIHDAEAAQRQADTDALSAQIDPFTREVDLDCE
ncbi:MAG: hypothetical protein ACRDT0_23740 [Pseudonocardiaceae bacterium]